MFEVRYIHNDLNLFAEEYDSLSEAIAELNWLFENGTRDVRIIQR